MISPQLRAMRLRAVNNKRLAHLRETRKELRKVYWFDWRPTYADASYNRAGAQAKVKYDG